MIINALIMVIDKLIKLTEFQNAKFSKRYNTLIEPVFNDLLSIHSDYIMMFEATISQLPNRWDYGRKSKTAADLEQLKKAVETLREYRLKFAPVRTKLRTLAKAIGEITVSAEEKRFIDAVVKYFPSANYSGVQGYDELNDAERINWEMTSDSSRLLKRLISVIDDNVIQVSANEIEFVTAYDISSEIEILIHEHRYSWSLVCEAYAPLKIAASAHI